MNGRQFKECEIEQGLEYVIIVSEFSNPLM